MKRSWMAWAVPIGAVAIGVGGFAAMKMRNSGAAQAQAQAPAFEMFESVEVVEAREIPWQATADLMGTVFAMRSVTTKNEFAGLVTFVGFDSGSVVEEGQVLVRQDDSVDRADLDAARASVRVAEANVAQATSQIALAQVELGRMDNVPAHALAEVDRDRARTKLDVAKADLQRWAAETDQAKAKVAQVEAHMAKLTLKAPFKASAGMRTVHEGQHLAEGTSVVTLQELSDQIYLDFAIPQEYAPRVTVGVTVMASAPLLGPEPIKITVAAVDATVDNETRNLRIRAVVDNPKGVLVPGMFVPVRVPIAEPKTFVVVPSMAVRRAAYANSVFVITPDEKGTDTHAHQRFVTLGQTLGEDVIVLTGLKAGERIAAAGSFKLHEGVKVMVGPPGGAAAPGGPAKPAAGTGGAEGGETKAADAAH